MNLTDPAVEAKAKEIYQEAVRQVEEQRKELMDKEHASYDVEGPGDNAGSTPVSDKDKLRMISDTVEGQPPFGTELANFRRRLRIILDL